MNEFVVDGDHVYLNVPYAEAYVPRDLFKEDDSDSTVAVSYGDGIKLVGLMNMRFFNSDTEPRNSKPLKTFAYPNTIITYPDSFTIETMAMGENDEPEQYQILKYYFGDIVMESESVEAVKNCTRFLNMITRGKIPNTIPYDSFINIWQNNFDYNSFNPGIPSVLMQMIWAMMCRDPNDVTKQFRMIYGTGKADPRHYQSVNMNTVAAATSVFSGLSFERITEKSAAAINMSRSGQEQQRSPVEAILTM